MTPGFQSKEEFQQKHFSKFCSLVAQHTGINLSSSKLDMVYRRFAPRVQEIGLQDFGEYCDVIQQGDSGEILEFANLITTNLTSFFREKHHFEYLEKTFIPYVREKNASTRKVRIWSAGCSTGEEPYSLAMTMNESFSGLDHWDVKILATDLDTSCLARGRSGLYPEKAIEGLSKERLKKWFRTDASTPGKVAVRVVDKLKKMITFNHLNLMHEWPFSGKFDAIFCRNVMIYFDKSTQQKLVKKFSRYQKPGDTLVIGHSENIGLITTDYELKGKTIYERR